MGGQAKVAVGGGATTAHALQRARPGVEAPGSPRAVGMDVMGVAWGVI